VESPTLPPRCNRPHSTGGVACDVSVALPLGGTGLSDAQSRFRRHKGATTESSSVFHLWQGFSIGAVIIGGFVTVLFVYAILRFVGARATTSRDRLSITCQPR